MKQQNNEEDDSLYQEVEQATEEIKEFNVHDIPTTEEDEEAAQVDVEDPTEENTFFPPNVINRRAYLAYLKFLSKPIFTTKRKVSTSQNQILDLSMVIVPFKKKIAHLPLAEQEKLLAAKSFYFKCFNLSLKLRRKALKPGTAHIGVSKNNLEIKKNEIIELFGKMFTVDEVFEILNREWKLPVTKQAVWSFRKAYNNVILQKIEEYKFAGIEDIRVTHKRSRLEELAWLYGQVKQRYKKGQGRDDFNALLKVLEQIRKETEGDTINIKGSIDMNVEENINMHVHMELKKGLNIKEVILSRVAAIHGVSANVLVGSLEKSFYNKLNSFINPIIAEDVVDEYETNYPSSKPYDFEKIRKVQKNLKAEQQKQIELSQPDPEVISKGASIKDKLKAKIAAKKREQESRQDEVKKFEDTRGDHVPRGNPNLTTHKKVTKH
jgi:hypothetical protein